MPRAQRSHGLNVRWVAKRIKEIVVVIASFITVGTFSTNTYNSLVSEQFYKNHETAYQIANVGFKTPDDWVIRFIVSIIIATVALYLLRKTE